MQTGRIDVILCFNSSSNIAQILLPFGIFPDLSRVHQISEFTGKYLDEYLKKVKVRKIKSGKIGLLYRKPVRHRKHLQKIARDNRFILFIATISEEFREDL